tara:strand:- start:482 stop:1087 length:606 start_codon:yes stop_codon:yes gene_type:complete
MISHKHKFILITPQKVGSTSICDVFLKYADIKKIAQQTPTQFDFYDEYSYVAPHLKRYGSKHITIEETKSGLDAQNKDINQYLKIGAIRNPFDRTVSFWKWQKKFKGSFHNFILKQKIKKPMYDFCTINGENAIDFFIRFENLQEDLNIVCDKIGIPRQELPHKNKSKHKHYTEYYDDETRQIVAEKYAKDIEYFGYEFGE